MGSSNEAILSGTTSAGTANETPAAHGGGGAGAGAAASFKMLAANWGLVSSLHGIPCIEFETSQDCVSYDCAELEPFKYVAGICRDPWSED